MTDIYVGQNLTRVSSNRRVRRHMVSEGNERVSLKDTGVFRTRCSPAVQNALQGTLRDRQESARRQG